MFQWFSGWLRSLPSLRRDRTPHCRWWRLALFGLTLPAFAAPAILPVDELASGVFMIPAPLADATPENRGRVVNTGFIVGRDGVIVIDSGANHRHGEAILATVARVTPKPVKLLINTHPHPQNVLGNSAFAERGIPILATAATVVAMNERCPNCLASLRESVGDEAMRGTRIQLPDTTLTVKLAPATQDAPFSPGGRRAGEEGGKPRLSLSGASPQSGWVAASQALEIAGRQLRLLHFGHGHTEGDLVVFDEASAALFSGDLIYSGQIPHLSEANTSGWIAALDQLAGLPIRILIPGRGPVGGAGDLAPIRRYLSELRQRVAAAYAEGRSADEAIQLAELQEFAGWQGYAARHGRNVQHVYFEIERHDLGGQPEGRR
jgi:glyoxylase-like metal-dependent hydrolase (beta-lactamase superfamily II)